MYFWVEILISLKDCTIIRMLGLMSDIKNIHVVNNRFDNFRKYLQHIFLFNWQKTWLIDTEIAF